MIPTVIRGNDAIPGPALIVLTFKVSIPATTAVKSVIVPML